MSHSSSTLSRRVLNEIQNWLQSRLRECASCSQCEEPVMPLDTLCPNCGQANPAKLSITTSVYLASGVCVIGGLGLILF